MQSQVQLNRCWKNLNFISSLFLLLIFPYTSIGVLEGTFFFFFTKIISDFSACTKKSFLAVRWCNNAFPQMTTSTQVGKAVHFKKELAQPSLTHREDKDSYPCVPVWNQNFILINRSDICATLFWNIVMSK